MRHTPHSCSVPCFSILPFFFEFCALLTLQREREKQQCLWMHHHDVVGSLGDSLTLASFFSPPIRSLSLFLLAPQHRGNFLQESSTSGRGIVVAWYGLIRDICEHEEYSPTGTWSSKAEKNKLTLSGYEERNWWETQGVNFSMYFFFITIKLCSCNTVAATRMACLPSGLRDRLCHTFFFFVICDLCVSACFF